MTALALVIGLFLAIAWLTGAVVLGAADRWKALVAPRWIPALILAIPLIAIAATLSVGLISVDHAPTDASGHHDGHAAVVAHAPLGRAEFARTILPFTLALSFVLAWRLRRSIRLGWQALAADHVGGSGLATSSCGTQAIVLADLGEPNARAVAWPTPRIVFDEGWWRSLAVADRGIVIAHERAHLVRRDPLVAFACCVASALLPRRTWSRAFARWRCWAEQAADLAAARAHGDPLPVADLLIRQQRARLSLASHSCAAIGFGEQHALEARVRALAFASTPMSALDPDLDARALGLIGALTAMPLILAPVVHVMIEAVLRIPY